MLDAYIQIEDIKELLDKVKPVNGLIKRSDFQKCISSLKEYKKPQIEPKNRIKNRQMLISTIEKHINSVQNKKIKPEITAHLEHLTKKNFTNRKVELFETDFWDEEDIKGEIEISNIAFDKNEVMEILGVSSPTLRRYEKLGIIQKCNITIRVYVSGVLSLSRHHLKIYKLNDIIKNISI